MFKEATIHLRGIRANPQQGHDLVKNKALILVRGYP